MFVAKIAQKLFCPAGFFLKHLGKRRHKKQKACDIPIAALITLYTRILLINSVEDVYTAPDGHLSLRSDFFSPTTYYPALVALLTDAERPYSFSSLQRGFYLINVIVCFSF